MSLYAGYIVYINLNEIVDKWIITIILSSVVILLVTLLLYFPLLRHLADLVEEKFSTIGVSFTSKKTGVNLNEIPVANKNRKFSNSSNKTTCGICGDPGGPVCEKCRKKMSKK